MIERLQRALEHIEELSTEAQLDLAQEIEDLTAPLDDLPEQLRDMNGSESVPASVRVALALAGAWSDLQDDDEFAALNRIRHAAPPTPSQEDQLSWLEDSAKDPETAQ